LERKGRKASKIQTLNMEKTVGRRALTDEDLQLPKKSRKRTKDPSVKGGTEMAREEGPSKDKI